MKAFWNDCGRGAGHDAAIDVDQQRAALVWSDEVRGVEGNFFGLIDDDGRTVQFYFDSGIPDHVGDAGHLRIVLLDFPQPALHGSFSKHVAIQDVQGLIETIFRVGADHRHFGDLEFVPW